MEEFIPQSYPFFKKQRTKPLPETMWTELFKSIMEQESLLQIVYFKLAFKRVRQPLFLIWYFSKRFHWSQFSKYTWKLLSNSSRLIFNFAFTPLQWIQILWGKMIFSSKWHKMPLGIIFWFLSRSCWKIWNYFFVSLYHIWNIGLIC